MLITEVIILIKDRQVVEYNSLEDYFTDYRYYFEEIKLKDLRYRLNKHTKEVAYQRAKLISQLYARDETKGKRN